MSTGETIEIRSPWDGSPVAIVHRAGPAEVERAIAAAVEAFEETRRLPSWRRAEVLLAIAAGIAERREELARTIALEAGKPIKTARVEVDRGAFTFTIAAEETKRIYGEIVPLDWLPGNDGRIAQVRRVPLGPIAGITPFNFPLNLVAHKVAPALAAGNPIVIRPASQTPVTSLKLAEIVAAAGWPAGGFSVVPSLDCDGGAARRGRPDQAPDVHGQPGRRLGAEGARRAKARHARARRQRRRDRRTRTPTSTTRPNGSSGAASPTRDRRASRCSASTCTRVALRRVRRGGGAPGLGAADRATRSTSRPTSAR